MAIALNNKRHAVHPIGTTVLFRDKTLKISVRKQSCKVQVSAEVLDIRFYEFRKDGMK